MNSRDSSTTAQKTVPIAGQQEPQKTETTDADQDGSNNDEIASARFHYLSPNEDCAESFGISEAKSDNPGKPFCLASATGLCCDCLDIRKAIHR
jgi:hypothetical protein